MMLWLVIGFVVVVTLLLALIFGGGGSPAHLPYELGRPLLSPAERSFFGVLEQAVAPQYRVLAKVRVADVIAPRKGLQPKQRAAAFNRIRAKHFDFVLCRADTLTVVAAVELDDSSHDREDRRQRDALLRGACFAAKLPLHSIKAQRSYNIPALRAQLVPGQSPLSATVSPPVKPGRKAQPVRLEPALGLELPAVDNAGEDQAGLCPECASPLAQRTAQYGELAGRCFTVCERFPTCRYIDRRAVL